MERAASVSGTVPITIIRLNLRMLLVGVANLVCLSFPAAGEVWLFLSKYQQGKLMQTFLVLYLAEVS